MKLMLQHAGQTAEYEFVNRNGAPLTNQQATALINYAAMGMVRASDLPEGTTLLQKAEKVLKVMGEKMSNIAKDQRREELKTSNESQIEAELG